MCVCACSVCLCVCKHDFHVCVIHCSDSAPPPAAPLAPPPQGHGLSPSGALELTTHKANRIREWGGEIGCVGGRGGEGKEVGGGEGRGGERGDGWGLE